MQLSFSTLWGSPTYRATESYRPYANSLEAKADRDFHAKQLKAEGKNVRRWVLKSQLRQYWSFGVPCDQICDVYMINVN